MLPQQYCLRWKYHHSNLQTMFSQLLDRGCFCDVTLACDGQLIRAHRVVLCACSTFFDTVLTNYASERDPIIIMKDVTFADVKSLIEFMYKGEINVEHASLASLLKTADDLKIKGLAEVSWRDDEDYINGSSSSGVALPAADPDFRPHSLHRSHDGYVPAAASISGVSGANATTNDMRGSPANEAMNGRNVSPPPLAGSKYQTPSRLPMLTPKPPHSITIAAAASSADQFYGPKRKRGRPPLDDAYDVFNVRNLTHYAGGHIDSQPFLEVGRAQHGDNLQRHSNSAYQQHIHQQQRRQRQKPDHTVTDSDDADDNQTDPEWITSNLEVNVAECDVATATAQTESDSNASVTEQHNDRNKLEPNDKQPKVPKSSPVREHERISADTKAGTGKTSPKFEHRFKKRNMLDKAREQRQREAREREKDRDKDKEKEKDKKDKDRQREDKYKGNENNLEVGEGDDQRSLLPRPAEDIESKKALASEALASSISGNTITASSISSCTTSSDMPGTSSQAKLTTASSGPPQAHTHVHAHPHTHGTHSGPPAHSHAHSHFAKYAAAPTEAAADSSAGGGYVLNEHGMLMTHDFPRHGNTAMGAAPPNGDHDFVDLKMEDYDVADLRLTSEEMSEWQDVIKMDDYLAKGRRPQFWEEPFTRRVLDAIKNKRLEMKKAARILGVSYGTLYGRYREVYGCLKHPYSSTMRPTQTNQLTTVQPRFDIVWPSPKRDSGIQPSSHEIGKIRPKDLSELWARPQM